MKTIGISSERSVFKSIYKCSSLNRRQRGEDMLKRNDLTRFKSADLFSVVRKIAAEPSRPLTETAFFIILFNKVVDEWVSEQLQSLKTNKQMENYMFKCLMHSKALTTTITITTTTVSHGLRDDLNTKTIKLTHFQKEVSFQCQ